jgi:hypothetical protein
VARSEPSDAAAAAERLFGVPLEDFVSERDALARSLKEQGKADDAAEIKGLRKPALPVWTVNQLARSHGGEVRKLVQSAQRLHKAHGASPATFGEALKAERDALEALKQRAREALVDAGRDPTDAVLARVAATLQGAASRPETVDLLVAGMLAEEVEPPGFEALAGIAVAPPRGAAQAKERRRSPDTAVLRSELSAARATARDHEREARQAENDAELARARAESAAQEVERLEQRLRDAR